MIHIKYSKKVDMDSRIGYEQIESILDRIMPGQRFNVLQQRLIGIYFSANNFCPHGRLAEFWPLDIHPFILMNKCSGDKDDAMIVLSKNINSIDQTEKYLIISHEIQHAVQYMSDKKSYLRSTILHEYGNDGNGILEYRVPAEIDADIVAIATIMTHLGKGAIDKLINGLRISTELNKQIYSDFLEDLVKDINRFRGFTKETHELWDSMDMESTVSRLLSSPQANNKRDRDIVKTYLLTTNL